MKKNYSIIVLTFVLFPFALSAQWNRMSNSPAQSSSLYFFNPQTGYALKNNEIYKTADGGSTWNSITTAFDSFTSLSDIYFVSQDTGFVLSSFNMTFAYPVSASVTYDGGITWNRLLGPFDGSVLNFHFQNSTHWYFHLTSAWSETADTIYHTTDAGATWTKTGNASEVQYNQLINNLIVYKDSVSPSQAKLFYKSADGGATWNLILTDTTEFAGFADFQFLNNSDGWVLLNQYNLTDTIGSTIYKTTDGGLIWNNYTLPAACKDPQFIHFTSSNTGYIISNNTAPGRSEIYKTTDAGQTWNIDFSANLDEYFFNGIVEYYQNMYVLGNDIITNRITTSVAEMNSIESTSFFPNPFSNETTLQTDKIINNATLSVYNFSGQRVKEIKNISGQRITLFRDELPAGLYFIYITEDNKIIKSDKLVIVN